MGFPGFDVGCKVMLSVLISSLVTSMRQTLNTGEVDVMHSVEELIFLSQLLHSEIPLREAHERRSHTLIPQIITLKLF